MDNEIQITGLKELQAQLDQLPVNIEKKLMRGALRAGLKSVLERARNLVHNVSGELAASLRLSTSARGGTVKATVKAGNKKAWYARFVEFGTLAHIITPKAGKALSFGGKEYAQLHHPGAMKKPYMRPAFDAAAVPEGEALRAVAEYLQPRITTELAKQADESDGS